jgi:hypothetical protein
MRGWWLGCALLACDGGAGDQGSDSGAQQEVEGCRSGPGPVERIALVSHPYAEDPLAWEVLSVDGQGELARTEMELSLGRATHGAMAFTPDGSLGFVPLDDGGLGVIEVVDGTPRVRSSGPWGELYVGAVAMHPSGERILLLDANWRENGGAVVEVAIDCVTGDLTERRRWPSKLAYAALPHGEGEWLIAADDVGDSMSGDLHRVGGLSSSSATLFPTDEDAIVSTMARAGDVVLVADFAAFGGGNRIGLGRVTADGLISAGLVTGTEDPVSIGVSPSGRSAVVSSGFGDALLALAIDDGAEPPVRLLGELSYAEDAPALPAAIVVVEPLGVGFVAENLGVRRLGMTEDGAITDLGRFELGTDVEAVVGAIGVQP